MKFSMGYGRNLGKNCNAIELHSSTHENLAPISII